MKKWLTILLLMMGLAASAQTYNNEWIDFSKTYYKFKIGATGLYRIPQPVIAAAGLANTPVQQFQLFFNGQEVPIYTSVSAGILGGGDYIEFWGQMNNGKSDKPLYRNPNSQHTEQYSLETDTATYFLTVNSSASPFHYNITPNDTTGNVLPAEPYFMYTQGTYFRSQINPGYAQVIGESIYSSSYEVGEFYSSGFISQGAPFTDNQNNLFVFNAGPGSSIKFGAAGCSDTVRRIQLRVNNSLLKDTALNSFNDIVTTVPFPTALISTSSAAVQFTNLSAATYTDRIVSSFYEINYPRQFNFGGQSSFEFELPAKLSGYYLQIDGFNAGSSTPVLYDRATGQRYAAIAGGGRLYFLLTGSPATRKLVLVNEDPSNVSMVTGLTTKNFINFADASVQGNYLIISHPNLYTGSSGNNPVVDYRTYRRSPAGGSFTAQIYDINELTDQFAFGVKHHPLAVRNFLSYARAKFATKPEFVLLIGRGMVYTDFHYNEGNPLDEQLNLVPTFGFPASDAMLSVDDGAHFLPLTPIGRIGAINGPEVEIYLQKLIEFESAQQTAPNTIAGRDWMKSVVHVTGATDPFLQSILCGYMYSYKQTIIDSLFGANVFSFCSTTLSQDDQISGQLFPSLFTSGIGLLSYFGHSSISALGFNLDDPSVYNNQGKYPIFYVNGCYAGNYYTFDATRVALGKSLSESYVFAKEKGSIAFVASSHYGVVNYLNVLLANLYELITHQDYGKPIGILQTDAAKALTTVLSGDYLARAHAEEISIHGDPALRMNGQPLPDYDIEASQVRITPAFISVSNNNFTVNARFVNLGKAVHDSISVTVTRKYPDGTSSTTKTRIPGILYQDSLQFSFPILATRDKGQNTITITVNSDNDVAEITTANNTVTSQLFIYQDELTPIYPYNYAIINTPTQKLYASTANPVAPLTQYVMEIDTTELFNSPLKQSKTIPSVGGILEYDPGIVYRDSTVYYWRASIVPASGGQYHWNEFSFVYIDSLTSTVGFNQSHFYQHQQSAPQKMYLAPDQKWKFTNRNNSLYIKNGVFPTAASNASDFTVEINGNSTTILSVCGVSGVIFNVFDPVTFKPWLNAMPGSSQYGSDNVCGINRIYNFQFNILDPVKRKAAVDFMDLIPDGYFVVVRDISGTNPATNTYAADWQADTATLGSGNSMYHRLVQQGFTGLDSFTSPIAWIFTYQKNRQTSFQPMHVFSQGTSDKIFINRDDYITPEMQGNLLSPKFGPAKKWKQLHWRGSSLESPVTDSVGLTVIGLDTLGGQTNLFNLAPGTTDFDISSVDAAHYPYLQLKLNVQDTIHATPYQLKYWRLNYVPVPEGALAGNLFLSSRDSLELGEKLEFGIAFKNISVPSFDSVRVSLSVIDKNNITHPIAMEKRKPLLNGDTLKIVTDIDTKNYPGLNTIFLDVNPNNDQPEQYHFNNFLYHNFYVRVDKTNPLLDVTFDNVHILNEDIVSSRPHILIKLKDEAKYLLLKDTSVLKVQLRYPDGSLHPYYFNSDTLRFTPAASSSDNTASVDFTPVFNKQINPEGDNYQLIVTGKDASGNLSSTTQYTVNFKVITKAMISNMLNYPNPFTTSTAFVFTITGSEVPQNIKIQILTITGKIVREITKEELGPLHVGRNITEFKWDGTDMYHQRLANGVYLYHVVTNLNGKSLDKYRGAGDNTDQYFTQGYGKMYLMR